MKYAILGMGFIYPRHLQAIKETGGEVLLTCDTDETKNPDFTSWEEMFESPKFAEVDAVVICTPNYLHASMARTALRKGKKVLCEKPLTIDGLDGLVGVNTVLQLRYAPKVLELKRKMRGKQFVNMVIRMYRDDKYWDSWKGNQEQSGGILYNLGIHYFDLLTFLLGDKYKILGATTGKKMATGVIEFEKGLVGYVIEITDRKDFTTRTIVMNGKPLELSNQENLSYEDLHTEVYKHFIKGEGISLAEASKSLRLVGDLLKFNDRNN